MGSSESELPDDVIHRIITKHLICDNKTAVRLSLVSKEFLKAVQRRRALVFEWDNNPISKTRCLQELEDMVSALSQDSDHHHLETFTIRAAPPPIMSYNTYIHNSIYDDHSSFDRCIELAAANTRGLINLNLHLWGTYVVPQPMLKVESLVNLDLESCHLPGTAESVITWVNLKRLRLNTVCIKQGVFENILRSCPLIQVLEILHCFFYSPTFHVKVSKLYHLNRLDIRLLEEQTFEVDEAPNLECLEHHHVDFYHRHHVDLGKHKYPKLRSLKFDDLKFRHDFFTRMEHQFPRLEELHICGTNPGIKTISLSSLSLKKITLTFIQGLEEANFDVPNLILFEFMGRVDVVPKLSFTGNSDGWISRIIYKISNANIDTSTFLKLKEFLDVNATNTTSIVVSFEEGLTEFKIKIDHRPQISANSKSFTGTIQDVTIWRGTLRTFAVFLSFAPKIIDGIFLICRPRSIIVMHWPDCKFPKLIYDNLMDSKRFNDHQLMWNLALIFVNKHQTQLPYQAILSPPQILDKDKFLELFKVD